jgi:hypothetical protein
MHAPIDTPSAAFAVPDVIYGGLPAVFSFPKKSIKIFA